MSVFPGGSDYKESIIQETGFDPWIRKIPCRREWLPTPIFLPGESHGQRSLAGYRGKKNKDVATTPLLYIIYSTGGVASGFFFFPLDKTCNQKRVNPVFNFN